MDPIYRRFNEGPSSSSPAMPPPPGVKPNFIDPPSQAPLVIAISVTFVMFAIICVVMRIHTRVFISRAIGWDDYASVIAMVKALPDLSHPMTFSKKLTEKHAQVMSIAFTVMSLLMIKYGLGVHMWNVTLERVSPDLFYLVSIGVILYPPLMLFAKSSILLLYHRVFKPNKVGSWAIYATLALVIIYNVAIVVANLLQCTPRKEDFDIFKRGKCITIRQSRGFSKAAIIAIVGGTFNSFTDFLILILPMPMVWKLHLPTKQKIAVLGIFATGAFVCAVSVLRVRNLAASYGKGDATWYGARNVIWTIIEANVGIACGCMPCLKPFFRQYIPKITKSFSKYSLGNFTNSSSSSSSSGPKSPGKHAKHRPTAGVDCHSAKSNTSTDESTLAREKENLNWTQEEMRSGEDDKESRRQPQSPLTMNKIDNRFAKGSFLELGEVEVGTKQEPRPGF